MSNLEYIVIGISLVLFIVAIIMMLMEVEHSDNGSDFETGV